MSFRLFLQPSAEKQLDRLPRPMQKRVVEKLAQIEVSPRMQGSVKLAGMRDCYRVRVGDYRIVYEISDARQIIYVTIIAHRREVYRGL